jgi:hypothetical protein
MGKHRRISGILSSPSAATPRAHVDGCISCTRAAAPLNWRAPRLLTDWPLGGRSIHTYSDSGQVGHGAKPLSGAAVSRASRLPGRGAHFFCARWRSGEARERVVTRHRGCGLLASVRSGSEPRNGRQARKPCIEQRPVA